MKINVAACGYRCKKGVLIMNAVDIMLMAINARKVACAANVTEIFMVKGLER